jgi:hypothetical protein
MDLRHFDTSEIERDTSCRLGGVLSLPVDLHAADAHAPARGQHIQFVVARDATRSERAGDHRAESANRERAIDGQSHDPTAARRPRCGGQLDDRGAELVEARTRF